ncbi:hypothetical protein [Actinoplanes sp. NPDC051851]|uniref:hypothetical protein n=1 Tax=Actinoplanes sp. NPDC051851 TaxID=3154753 RepID=UPI00342810F7
MDSAFLSSVPQAVAIWLTIVVLLAVAAATIRLPRRLTRPSEAASDAARYADEIGVAADRAAVTAERRRSVWESAQEEVGAAWGAYERADREARRIASATAYPMMSRRRKPGENVDRQRYLHRAASELCRTQDLPISALNDVFAHRGWNPRLHPVQQEAVLANAVREHRLRAYRRAVEREQTTWRAAEAAAEALRALRAEAMAAPLRDRVRETADERWWTEQWTTPELRAAA